MPHSRRHHRINRMESLATFLECWRVRRHPDNRAKVPLAKTEYGNINSTGILGNYDGPALSRWHPQFVDAIEPGVRELVLTLTDALGWVTYTSCEGHNYAAHIPATERHVGILPRSEDEFLAILETLSRLERDFNRKHFTSPIAVRVEKAAINSPTITLPVVDLFFRRRFLRTWSSYFNSLDGAYHDFISLLRLR